MTTALLPTPVLVASFVLAAALVPLAVRAARRYGVLDDPGPRKVHRAPTPRVGGVAVNRIDHWQFADSDPMDNEVERASYETTSVYGKGHLRYYDNVIQALRGLAEPDTDGREGLRSLELLTATYLSAREGKRIALPLPD